MLKLFNRRREKKVELPSVLERMAIAMDRQQRKAANYLNNKVSVFSAKQLKMGLILFCVLFGSSTIYIIWKSIYQPAKIIVVKPIEQPGHAVLPKEHLGESAMLNATELRSIINFQKYIDSLQRTQKGRMIYDSIMSERPGLLDSLSLIQQLFSEQLKTK